MSPARARGCIGLIVALLSFRGRITAEESTCIKPHPNPLKPHLNPLLLGEDLKDLQSLGEGTFIK